MASEGMSAQDVKALVRAQVILADLLPGLKVAAQGATLWAPAMDRMILAGRAEEALAASIRLLSQSDDEITAARRRASDGSRR